MKYVLLLLARKYTKIFWNSSLLNMYFSLKVVHEFWWAYLSYRSITLCIFFSFLIYTTWANEKTLETYVWTYIFKRTSKHSRTSLLQYWMWESGNYTNLFLIYTTRWNKLSCFTRRRAIRARSNRLVKCTEVSVYDSLSVINGRII